jgi:hypothetical protein
VSYSKNASFRKNVDDSGRFLKTTGKINYVSDIQKSEQLLLATKFPIPNTVTLHSESLILKI